MDFTERLDHLDSKGAAPNWEVRQVVGGANGLVYRAHKGNIDVCVKFSAVDEYDRVGREYAALSVLQELSPGLAPTPLLLDHQGYSQPVIV